jgi:enoyl-CoA hydratase/carnithine racemase
LAKRDQDEFTLSQDSGILLLTLASPDRMNRLTRRKIRALCETIECVMSRRRAVRPLLISGVPNFSAGADLNEISQLSAPDALTFAHAGQHLMNLIEHYRAPVFAAISGYCMGGGLDLALACHRRIAAPDAIFGHRGAALGLITGWGGTQRLPRVIGKARALEMLVAAEKIHAAQAVRIGLVSAVAEDPVANALQHLGSMVSPVSTGRRSQV